MILRDVILKVVGNGTASAPAFGALKAITITSESGAAATRSVSVSAGLGSPYAQTFGPVTVGSGSAQYAPRLQAVGTNLTTTVSAYSEFVVNGTVSATVTGANPTDVTLVYVYLDGG
jgi:hypothetical protein